MQWGPCWTEASGSIRSPFPYVPWSVYPVVRRQVSGAITITVLCVRFMGSRKECWDPHWAGGLLEFLTCFLSHIIWICLHAHVFPFYFSKFTGDAFFFNLLEFKFFIVTVVAGTGSGVYNAQTSKWRQLLLCKLKPHRAYQDPQPSILNLWHLSVHNCVMGMMK